jgi:uncharacterized membrane protein YraQ (UPF0718 family)
VVGRVVIVWATAAIVGAVFIFYPEATAALRSGPAEPEASHSISAAGRLGTVRGVLTRAGDDFVMLSRWLILGALLAAALCPLVPHAVATDIGQGAWLSVIVLMGLAALLSVCSVVDSFVALSFAQNVSLGAVLAFLAFGAMVDVKSTLMYLDVFRRGVVVVLLILSAQVVLLAALLANLLLGY